MRKRRILRAAALAVALLAAVGASLYLLEVWNWFGGKGGDASPASEFPGIEEPPLVLPGGPVSGEPFNVLILGLDHGAGRPEQGNRRSDVVMVVHIDERARKAALLSIPRDSYVEIPGHGKAKINEAYQLGGASLAVETVQNVTGMHIRNYLVLDFDEFAWLVDLYGGVPITMEEPLVDPKVGYIPAGSQVLDGKRALVLARSRDYPEGDLERVRQQQRILVQALYKGRDFASTPGAAWFLAIAVHSLETDLQAGEVIALAREFAAFPAVNVQGGVAPGRTGSAGRASVYFLDRAGLAVLVQSIEEDCYVPEQFR